MKRIVFLIVALMATAAAGAVPFINHGKPVDLLNLNVHVMVGGAEVTQNFMSTYPEISELDMSMGTSLGFGATAEISFTDFLGLGVQTNVVINNYRTNLAVANDDGQSMSSVFIKNHYYTLNFPVYFTTRFNLGSMVRWNVDAGLYYSYGLGGNSKATIFNAQKNDLGQLTQTVSRQKADYYNSDRAFLTSSYRSDIGLHLATGFLIARKVHLGLSFQIGFKNVSHVYNAAARPCMHNINFFVSGAYCF